MLRGRCLPYGEGITFLPVVEVVKEAAGLDDVDAPRTSSAKICAVLDGAEHRELVCRTWRSSSGVAEAQRRRGDVLGRPTVLRGLGRASGPLVVVFDDIHWGEPTFLDLSSTSPTGRATRRSCCCAWRDPSCWTRARRGAAAS